MGNRNDKGRTKHMYIRYHYVREFVPTNQIQVLYRPTTTMIADILTKPLYFKQFSYLRSLILGNLG